MDVPADLLVPPEAYGRSFSPHEAALETRAAFADLDWSALQAAFRRTSPLSS
jgi:hypothetical protein